MTLNPHPRYESLKSEVARHRRTFQLPDNLYCERPPFPSRMMIEVTNACNHRCLFCANPRMDRPGSLLPFALFKRLVGEAATLGVRELSLYSTGEPLLHPDFILMVVEAKHAGLPLVNTTTNGVLLDEATAQACFAAGLDQIRVSVNAGDSESYRSIHGRDHFERVVDNLRVADRVRRELGSLVRIRVSCVVTRSNQATAGRLRDLLGDVVDEIVFFPVGPQAGLVRDVSIAERPDEFIIQNPEMHYTVPSHYIPCSYVFDRVHVTAEGFLTLCSLDFDGVLRCADVRHSSLQAAWWSESFAALRQRHLQEHLEGLQCDSCVHTAGALTQIAATPDA